MVTTASFVTGSAPSTSCCIATDRYITIDSGLFMKSPQVIFTIVFSLLPARYTYSQSYDVRHLAGSPGGPGTADGVGAAARFMTLNDITGDGTYVYVADQHRIRRVTVQTGEVTTVGGDVSVATVLDAR